MNCFQGLGEADTYREAKASALGDLCMNIRVSVHSEIETSAKHKMQSTGSDRKIDYQELSMISDKLKSDCVFEGMPVKEKYNEKVDGRQYVLLSMTTADYLDYMSHRYAKIQMKTKAEKSGTDGLTSAFIEMLHSRGYLVLKSTGQEPDFLLEASYAQHIKKTAMENLLIGEASISFSLVRTEDKSVIESYSLNDIVARGFSEDTVESELIKKAVEVIQKKIGF
jgi:hypothetical protein